ncbi:unnamed protein product [Rotaria magnacalcarata]|uniref:Protein SHQ1 homolog n=1 Tax=Rotaria magnacalcarata TaxID=392030 RepID=A0A819VFJ3_9BILA|nr:unnamed protein product [Rotaria magnacalcarata]CAF4108484.1 unnamed protein product [Rotaria magnacalcarata]
MLIPRFSLSQTATHLAITIRCPYVKFSSSNDNSNGIEVDLPTPDEFYFACKPYYLHLYLPGHVIDKGLPDYKYDIDASSFCFNFEKEIPNEHFEDLDMLTKLLNKENKVSLNKVEEIDRDLDDEQDEEDDDDEPLWNRMRQLEIDDQPKENLISSYSYGFNHQYKEIFSNFDSEYSLTFDNQSPDTLPTSSIRSSRLEKEQLDFNCEHYLVDKHEFDNEMLFNFKLTIDDELNDQDRDDLKNLKYKKLLIDDQIPIYLGLIDILYAFVYDQRLTQGEPCCESPWNIHKLSSTLAWFDSFTDLPSVLISCCRRTLIYPLNRSFKLARKCLLDVIEILSMGKCAILQCFLQMRRLFLDEEHRYLLNTLYLNDYCLWIQTECHTQWLNSLIEAMKHTIDYELDENDLGLDFEEKRFSWKVNLCEASDTDDDDCVSSSEEQ